MYTQQGGHLAFFAPLIALAENAAEVLKEVDIGASSGTHGELLCVKQCRISQLQFTLTSEAASGTVTAPVVTFKHRPTPLSASGESTIDTVIVPSGTGIGKTVYTEVDPFEVKVGETVQISWTIGSGTPTGIGCYSMVCNEDPESSVNNSDMIESA